MQASLGAVSMFRNPHTGPDTVSGPVENFCATFVLLLPGRPTVGHPVDNTFLCYFCATFAPPTQGPTPLFFTLFIGCEISPLFTPYWPVFAKVPLVNAGFVRCCIHV